MKAPQEYPIKAQAPLDSILDPALFQLYIKELRHVTGAVLSHGESRFAIVISKSAMKL